jgi:hypothetical protein
MNNRQCLAQSKWGPLNNSNRPLIGPVESFHEPIGWSSVVFLVFAETHQNGRMRSGVSEEVRGPRSTLPTRCRELINLQLGCGVRYAANSYRFLRRREMSLSANRRHSHPVSALF